MATKTLAITHPAFCITFWMLNLNYALSLLMTTSRPDKYMPHLGMLFIFILLCFCFVFKWETWTISVKWTPCFLNPSFSFHFHTVRLNETNKMFPLVNFSNQLRLPLFLVFVDCLFVFTILSNLCKDTKTKRFYVNKIKFTVAIHSCMSFEALKFICMHETVKFFLLLTYAMTWSHVHVLLNRIQQLFQCYG